MKVIYKNTVSEVKKLAQDIQQFCTDEHLDETMLYDLNLCLEEVITNIIRYGFKDHKTHPIELTIERHVDKIVAIIRDEGIPFNPLEHIHPPVMTEAIDQKPMGGLGLYFVHEKMDELEYSRQLAHNIFKMTKYLQSV